MPEKANEEWLRRERAQVEALYMAIGQFIVEFFQLEFMIRNALGDALEIPDSGDNTKFDIVTSPYDFATLCNVTRAAYLRLSDRSDGEKARSRPSSMRPWT